MRFPMSVIRFDATCSGVGAVLIAASFFCSPSIAQTPAGAQEAAKSPANTAKQEKPAADNAKSATAPGQQKKTEIPEPESLLLETKDRVQLVGSYFAPAAAEDPEADGSQVIPYLLLHDWGGSRQDMLDLAKFLQQQGNAVLVPDLRGHGGSLDVTGVDKPLNYEEFRAAEIGTMLLDIERCKRELVKQNNERQLNVDMLTVIAVGKSVPVAAQWVINDWYRFPAYNRDGIKQAQDVKVLVMIAPEKKHGPFSLTRLIGHPLFQGDQALPTIVMWGTRSKQAKEVESIFKKLEKGRPSGKKVTQDKKSLFPARIPRDVTGTQIVSDLRMAKIWQGIHRISSAKIGQVAEQLPWADRSKKTKKQKNDTSK